MRDAYKPELTTLGIAAAGVYGTIGANTSVSIPDSRLSAYFGDLWEGGTVIDKRPCPSEVLVRGIVSGPMLKESLPPGSVERFINWPVKVEQYLPGQELKGFDHVSLDVYCSLWETMGAKVGTRKGEVIRWNDGTETPIPPEAQRYNVKD